MDQEKVGKFIKKLRKDNNLTQSELANKLGVTYQAVSKWENGKNIPDIATLKEISNMFDIDIDEIISGREKEKKKNKYFIYFLGLGIILVLVVTLFIIHIFNDKKEDNDNSFEFKVINTTCDDFTVNGSLAYSKDKSYIYISNIEFCGDEEIIYKEIKCTLYEKYGNVISEITSCDIGYNETLKEHLKKVKLSTNNYKTICSGLDSAIIYLEITAVDSNLKTTTYKIPLEVENTCR